MVSTKEVQKLTPLSIARMIVLVPKTVENTGEFSGQVYQLAAGEQREVLYVALSACPEDRLAAARTLATLQALTQASAMHARTLLLDGQHWAGALKSVAQPGDVLVCPLSLARAEGDALQKELAAPLLILPAAQEARQPLVWVRQLAFWLVALAILVGFSLLEVRLAQNLGGALMRTILIALFALELGAISLCNRLLG